MRIAFDTNIILDAVIEGRDGGAAAKHLILAAAREEVTGLVSANCITDIYYVARKYLGDENTREAIYRLLTVFDVIDVSEEDCLEALQQPMSDFEDALLAVCSKKAKADYIVTGDEGFLAARSPVPTVTANKLIALLQA